MSDALGNHPPAGEWTQEHEMGDGTASSWIPGPPECQNGTRYRDCCLQVRLENILHMSMV